MNHSFRTLSLVASLSAAGLLAACGGGGGGSSPPPGTLGVSMTDAPACGYDAVNVTVRAVRVHQSSSAGENDGGWATITLPVPKKINLLNLTNGVLEELGQTSLAAGHYTQLRLVLDPNNGNSMANSVILTTTPTNTTEISLDTPSAVQSGIKLTNQFEVLSNQRVDLVLDFDACKSIVTKGSGAYALKPVITVIPTVMNGIDGYVNTSLLSSNVMVSAQQNGVVVRSTVPDTAGKFTLARLAPGNYDVVITADGRATAVIGTVPVASTSSRVDVSTSAAPIVLQTSATRNIGGTVLLSPSSTTEVGYVAAQQTFAAGPKVTVKYRGADISNGTYSLASLPTAAPQYGQYSATLPITLTTQTTTTPGTGKYLLEASALGYVTQTNASVDLTPADQSGIDFTLVK
ncbi:MAG: hypothetical protein A3I66_21535 [Burkholderiales bacterium RIFCSPLOWO2_02_FULL_57_36]|nr:MAG: hypothetical protein A3I66_21535 [Burkholderiales bacterium RIFCSPLOWO2_02_FULL_57_36]